jgi:small subunit ribosomal protein S20
MANLASSKKALRVSLRKNIINARIREGFKTARKDFLKAVADGSKDVSEKLSVAYARIDAAAKKGVIHKNTASRYKSRLASTLKSKSK